MNNKLFDVLNWILKKKSNISDFDDVSCYIVNRWLTMASNDFCNIINLTSNRWLTKNKDIPYFNFYKAILPKHNRKIDYIKKTKIEDVDISEIKNLAENKEVSIKEIIFLEKQLEEFKSISK